MSTNFQVAIQINRHDKESLELSTTRNGCQWTTINHSRDEMKRIADEILLYLYKEEKSQEEE